MRFRSLFIAGVLTASCIVAVSIASGQTARRGKRRSAGENPQGTVTAPAASPAIPAPAPAATSAPTQPASAAAWTWKDSSGQTRSRADLDQILAQHQQWAESKGQQGKRADLTGADLSGADLSQADLREANLAKVKLTGATLSQANLSGSDLSYADLSEADLEGVNLRKANLYGAKLVGAQLGLKVAPIAAARVGILKIFKVFKQANGEPISDRLKAAADLSGADLRGADLTDAWFRDADLDRTIYEPSKDPPITGIARARHLDLVTYVDDPEALVRLRKGFSDGGFVQAENKITYAVNRRETAQDKIQWRWFRRIAFDWTCQYGMNPGRPLKILGLVWLVMTGFYFLFMHLKGPSGIYVEATRESRGRERKWRLQVRLPRPAGENAPRSKGALKPGRRLRREWRLARAAMFFSLTSAFNIGYQELNIGEWLKMLTRREYDLRAVGWVRTAAGVQSLLGLYMLALWVLTFFGHPFE
jgi:uncharacterized protein YjbI with pentapeptide repeats